MKARQAPIAMLLLLAGCGGIEQKVKPITIADGEPREICVVENTAVRLNFLDAYKGSLAKRNFTVRVLPEGSAVGTCPLTSTYTANWNWDLALYLTFVDMKVYRNNHLEAEAVYDSLKAGLDTNKFVDGGAKIQELTDKLFPN